MMLAIVIVAFRLGMVCQSAMAIHCLVATTPWRDLIRDGAFKS